ncbi:hypothetical protein ANCCAN_26211, partial [Ancylostoma caninum]
MSKPSRLEKKAQDCFDKGEFYEAHQVYRTMYFRMIQQEKFDELLDMLCSGSKKLARGEQNFVFFDIDLSVF